MTARINLLARTDDAMDRALALLDKLVIGYHRTEFWITVPRSMANAAMTALRATGIEASMLERQT